MFLQASHNILPSVQQAALILNTILLLGLLVALEMFFAGKPKTTHAKVVYFAPLVIVLVGVLLFAGFSQTGEV